LLGDDLGLIEEVGWEDAGGVEDFDADEAVVAPVECDERVGGWPLVVSWCPAGNGWPVRWM
jgi:hypothetical protein